MILLEATHTRRQYGCSRVGHDAWWVLSSPRCTSVKFTPFLLCAESMAVAPVSESEFKAAADSLANLHGMSDEEVRFCITGLCSVLYFLNCSETAILWVV